MGTLIRLTAELPEGGEPATFLLSGDRDALVGRDASCDVVIEHATVSGRHGLLRAGADGYTYTDLGSRNGSALMEPSGAARALTAGEEAQVGPGFVLLLGAADAPVKVSIERGASAFAPPPSATAAAAAAGAATGAGRGQPRTIVASAPLSDLFVAAPTVLSGLAADVLAAEAPDDLADAALGAVRKILPAAEGVHVRLTGAGFSVDAGDTVPGGLSAEALSQDEVLLYEQEGDQAMPMTESIARAGIRAAIVAPLAASGTSHGHLIAWSSLGSAALPQASLAQLAVAAPLVALAAAGLAVRSEGEEARRLLVAENERLRGGARSSSPSDVDPIGNAPLFVEAVGLCRAVASADVPVLLLGETGSGKEVLARAVHRWSRRSAKPFVAFNCAAVPEALLESELFGHVRGSFTGATGDRKGLFEEANGGTVFLDEIGEMAAVLQAKLLRVLQEGEVRRVGASKTSKVDVRVISATHQDLPERVKAGTFRADLMYRLNAVTVRIPALRERRSDIPTLAHFLLGRLAGRAGRRLPGLAADAIAALSRHDWPGNVRELENEIMRAIALTPEGSPIRASVFSPTVAGGAAGAGGASPGALAVAAISGGPTTLRAAVEVTERATVQAAVERSGGNVSAAARELGLTRPGLYKVMDRLGLRG